MDDRLSRVAAIWRCSGPQSILFDGQSAPAQSLRLRVSSLDGVDRAEAIQSLSCSGISFTQVLFADFQSATELMNTFVELSLFVIERGDVMERGGVLRAARAACDLEQGQRLPILLMGLCIVSCVAVEQSQVIPCRRFAEVRIHGASLLILQRESIGGPRLLVLACLLQAGSLCHMLLPQPRLAANNPQGQK